jgi:hypothetical protein
LTSNARFLLRSNSVENNILLELASESPASSECRVPLLVDRQAKGFFSGSFSQRRKERKKLLLELASEKSCFQRVFKNPALNQDFFSGFSLLSHSFLPTGVK